jgi:2-haloacid dehalogenase
MPEKPTLVFDLGGVLIDWNPRHLYRKLFPGDESGMEHFLKEVDFPAWNMELDRGAISFAQAVRELSAQFPQRADLIRAYDERWEESLNGPIQPVVDALYKLKANGYSLHGLTNWSAEKFALVQHKYAFFNLFESILVSGTVRLVKPDPRIYSLLLNNIQRAPSQCIFIDDSLKNVNAASELGFIPLHFQSPGQFMAELQGLGVEA